MQLQKNDIIFHNWKINRVIGTGSFGTVYEIEREEFGRVYKAAAKVITIPDDSNAAFQVAEEGMTEENVIDYYKSLVNDIISECDVMERMKGDSHIVSLEDHYVEEHENGRQWTIYIRMELLKSLISFIQDEEHFLKRDQIIHIGMDICKGLETCQKFNVVHRDIKLENIFVSDTGNYKLGDFGISKVIEESELAVSQKGTKLYMAPEMFRGEKYDATVDIYSLGLVLYRLLNNNRAPFMPAYPQRIYIQDKESALHRRLMGEVFPDPCNADEPFACVIRKACSFAPKGRYQTPKAMREALENLLENSKDISPFERDMEEHSKTFCVQGALGRYSLKKSSVQSEENRKSVRKYARAVLEFLIVMVIFAMGMINYFENTKKDAKVNAKVNASSFIGIVSGKIIEQEITQLAATGSDAAKQEFEAYWMIVPRLLDMEESKAIELLLETGYLEKEIDVAYEYSDVVSAGLIIYQSEEPSHCVKKGTGISIIVSLGGKPTVTAKNKTEESESNIEWRELE